MNAQSSDNVPPGPDAVLRIVRELASRSYRNNYMYRGERKEYSKVSSSLYRRYADIEAEGFDIEVVQEEILAQARGYTRYTGEVDDFEILSQLQHNGGETNLIDFTTDYLIALFFACDGEPNEPGRVILLAEVGEDYSVAEPSNPVHRVIAQKSVFVRPNKGFVEPSDTIIIDSSLKAAILEFLRSNHGISTETIYNDLHGFIRHQGIHQSAYTEFYKGFTLANKANHQQAVEHYTKAITLNSQMAGAHNNRGNAYYDLGDYRAAIADYDIALSLDPESPAVCHNLGNVYAQQGNYLLATQYFTRALDLGPHDNTQYRRAEAWLHLSEWERARQDLSFAALDGANVAALFRNDYVNVADFEHRNNLQMPQDIADMLGG